MSIHYYCPATWYTKDIMMKFASFETIAEMLEHVIPQPKDQCSSSLQLGVNFASGPNRMEDEILYLISQGGAISIDDIGVGGYVIWPSYLMQNMSSNTSLV